MKFWARLAAFGGAGSSPALNVYSFVALYNDDTIGRILRVRQWTGGPGSGSIYVSFVQGTIGALVARGVALWSAELGLPGQIYNGNSATAPGQTYVINGNLYQGTPLSTVPLAYLIPGWSLIAKNDTPNTSIGLGFIWECLQPDLLDPEELGIAPFAIPTSSR